MRAGKLWASTLAVLVAFVVAGQASADTILNTGGTSELRVNVGSGTPASNAGLSDGVPTALPFVLNRSISLGGATNSSSYNLSQDLFSIGFIHERGGVNSGTPVPDGDLAAYASSFGDLYFSVTADRAYTIAGSYAAQDPAGRYINVGVLLADLTTNTTLLLDVQESRATPNEAFVVGQGGGDFENTFQGSLTGTLLAGHDYRFYYQATIMAIPTGDNGASATGGVTLAFAPVQPTAAPLPPSAWGGLALLGGLGLTKLHRRRAAIRTA